MAAQRKQTRSGRPKKKAAGSWQTAFLDELRITGVVTFACRAAGVHRSTVYAYHDSHDSFRQQWGEALDEAADLMEHEARRRAVEGVERPVFGSGGPGVGTIEVGKIREYSDTLLIFLLKAARPQKYRENLKVTHDGQVRVTVRAADLTDDQLAAIAARGLRRSGRRRAAETPESA